MEVFGATTISSTRDEGDDVEVKFEVCYLPFTIGPDLQVDRVGVPRMVECEMHYSELMADPQGPPGHYLVALWAVVMAACEVDHPMHRAPGGFIGSGGTLLGYGPFNFDGKLPRRLRSKVWRGFAEQAARVVLAEDQLRRAGYWRGWGKPNLWRYEEIIDGLFAHGTSGGDNESGHDC